MDGFNKNGRIGLKIFSEFGNEYIHAPAQVKIVIAPNFHEDFFSRKDPVWIFAEIQKQLGFPLGDIVHLLVQYQFILVK